MPALNPDDEQQVIDALIVSGWSGTEQSLKALGIIEIGRVLNCSAEQAGEILSDLLDRKLIEPDISRGGQLDGLEADARRSVALDAAMIVRRSQIRAVPVR